MQCKNNKILYQSKYSAKKKKMPLKKVQFSDDNKIYIMRVYPYAMKMARKSNFISISIDRKRFNDRIRNLSNIISPILEFDHRKKIYEKYIEKNESTRI